MPTTRVDRLSVSGVTRELLRQKGQFWTPDWIARAMLSYVLAEKPDSLFDPAVGTGIFFRLAKQFAQEKHFCLHLVGMEIEANVLQEALKQGLDSWDLASVTIGDFVLQPPQRRFPAIVANPPYIRHHRLSMEKKEQLRQVSLNISGRILDGRAGLHVYFLMRALSLLQENGRLAFIMPADTCEGKFANDLWNWITKNYALEAVITFAPEATPFPGVDTNPIIFLICNAQPKSRFWWAKCRKYQTEMLEEWIRSAFLKQPPADVVFTIERDLTEGLSTGLSRPPCPRIESRYVLGDFVSIVRGVASGANDFFLITEERAKELGIPAQYFVRAISRTRDISSEEISQKTLEFLSSKGRPTFLLNLGSQPIDAYPEAVKQYLKKGEELGLHRRPLISQRKPWYKMETRVPPPFLFAYLGRRNVRFIRNTAGVIPLTGFLCVYPKYNDANFLERLWRVLNHPGTLANLSLVAKSYGDGALKVEPRALEKLPIPDLVIAEAGLSFQMRLFELKETSFGV
jgi:adenine-specific DNA-methyltransferase